MAGGKQECASRGRPHLASEEVMASSGETHRQDNAATVKVEGAIDGVSCLMTVDTGAERTIVRPEMI